MNTIISCHCVQQASMTGVSETPVPSLHTALSDNIAKHYALSVLPQYRCYCSVILYVCQLTINVLYIVCVEVFMYVQMAVVFTAYLTSA